MPVSNLHQKPSDEGTRDKLELYRDYLREWLPVFINGSSVDILRIFDINYDKKYCMSLSVDDDKAGLALV